MATEPKPQSGQPVSVSVSAVVGGGTGGVLGAGIGVAVAGTAMSAAIPLAVIGAVLFGGAAYIKNLQAERNSLRRKASERKAGE